MVYGRVRMRRHARTILAALLGAGLMAFVLRGADPGRVGDALTSARGDLIALGLLAMVAADVARVVRWCYLLEPLGRVGWLAAFRATMMGQAATSILPGRVGEVLRPYVLARRERLSVPATIGTAALERLLDVAANVAIFGFSAVVFEPRGGAGGGGLLPVLHAAAAAAAGLVLGALGLAYAAAAHPASVGRRVARATSVLPAGLSRRLARLSHGFSEGFEVLRRPAPLAGALAWTAAVWLLIAAGLWCVTAAFGIDMPPAGAGLMLLPLAWGVALPTPAGVGGYHAVFQVGATTLFAAGAESAVGAGLVAHAISFLPPTMVGVPLMAYEGVRLADVRGLAARASDAPASGADDETGA